ncbi:hypothetical protein [Microvirga terricola]|uniref:Dienelactone hydrolase domain-containing protein n=1 Tax=Microvirga terricola TaxID=2719797 RepID=A0ABX0V7J8_9HYPH|nr:hypothetical protein [Microvirga terricola]NIX75050.1 hypothetical protein [Microvirga terricola]
MPQHRAIGSDGLMDAIRASQAIVPGQEIRATGYCLGGTLLFLAAE